MSCGIYKFTNKLNNKIYIGQSTDIESRYKKHFRKDNARNITYFHKACEKYGKQGFNFEILELCPKELLNEREKYYINLFKSNDLNIGYNMTPGGEGKAPIPVYQYDLTGFKMGSYISVTEASDITGIPASNIVRNCKGNSKSAGGFQWSYEDLAEINKYIDNRGKNLENHRNINGRPKGTKNIERIKNWRAQNPNGTVQECLIALQLGKSTVYKYWDKN